MAFRRRVVVVAEQAAIQETFVTCVRPLGVPVVTAARVDELSTMAPALVQGVIVLVWPPTVDEVSYAAMESRLGQLAPDAEVVAIYTDSAPTASESTPAPSPGPNGRLAACLRLLDSARCNHVVLQPAHAGDLTGPALAATRRCVATTVRKLLDQDLFGIEKYVTAAAGDDDTATHCLQLRDYAGRLRAIEAVTEFVEKLGLRRALRSAIVQAAEELLMNALYDAPVDAAGLPVFGEVDSRDRLAHPSPRPVALRYSATADHVVLAVRDHFGGLRKETWLRYLAKQAASTAPLEERRSGAGLGLYFVASVASDYVINVAPGVATEVICTFDKIWSPPPLRSLSHFVARSATPSSTEPR